MDSEISTGVAALQGANISSSKISLRQGGGVTTQTPSTRARPSWQVVLETRSPEEIRSSSHAISAEAHLRISTFYATVLPHLPSSNISISASASAEGQAEHAHGSSMPALGFTCIDFHVEHASAPSQVSPQSETEPSRIAEEEPFMLELRKGIVSWSRTDPEWEMAASASGKVSEQSEPDSFTKTNYAPYYSLTRQLSGFDDNVKAFSKETKDRLRYEALKFAGVTQRSEGPAGPLTSSADEVGKFALVVCDLEQLKAHQERLL